MDISKFLGKAVGIYLVILSVIMFVDMNQFTVYITNLLHNPPLMFITGFISLIIGILMVVSHNIWEWSWRLIITMIAWAVLIKGISIIIYPHVIDRFTYYYVTDMNFSYGSIGVNLVMGLVLIYFSFRPETNTRQKKVQ